MRKWQLNILLLALLVFLLGCSDGEKLEQNNTGEQPVEILISAAASMTNVMEELKEMYEANNNVNITFNFAGSGKLAQQIEQGAPVDVFISANEAWMETLIEEDLVVAKTRIDVTGNALVLISHETSDLDYATFSDLKPNEVGDVAIGNPESVPAGDYTRSVLGELDLWDEFESHFIFAQDVRQVLTYVESENVDLGFVYESDALSSNKVKILAKADQNLHERIIYPGAVVSASEHRAESEAFLSFMLTDEAQKVLATYGFIK